MKCVIYFVALFGLALGAAGETFQYELKGNFKQSGKEKTVSYTLRWSEDNDKISGLYSDDYFTRRSEVKGQGSDLGRTFIVEFPQTRDGVRSLIILSSLLKKVDTGTSVPVSIVSRDEKGNPLTNLKTSANFITTSVRTMAQLQEENRCTDGFGVLAGFCGVYAGILTERRDRRNWCNLLFADAVRLELTEEGMILLHLGERSSIAEAPIHTIGRIPFNPEKNSVDVMGRVCMPLYGLNTTSGSSCKVLHLRGDFSRNKDNLHFSGTYQISEEGTNNVCVYGLSMDKVETLSN
jgi:hypothetical protein